MKYLALIYVAEKEQMAKGEVKAQQEMATAGPVDYSRRGGL